jgi:hypothetical protein
MIFLKLLLTRSASSNETRKFSFNEANRLLTESLLCLQTIADVDQDNDGKISKEDWKAFASRNPSLLKNMTLPYLKYVKIPFYLSDFSKVNNSHKFFV